MNFNFFNGRMPFFGGRPSFSGMDLSDIAEDVPFEEVKSEQTKTQHKIDEVARGAQVSAVTMSRFGSFLEKAPMTALLLAVIFSAGAKWADQHPVSEFGGIEEWRAAQRKKIADMINELPDERKADAFIVMLHHAIFAEGAQWAIETPAPTI
ncbi:MAG: hypothetical protein K2N91_08230 [Muribaculaceae bacterium]|nr:hypothetical protein [Muribaculaceae bacterium]